MKKRVSECEIDRRTFFKSSAIGAASAAAIGSSCGTSEIAEPSPAVPASFELDEFTVSELQNLMESKKASCKEIVKLYLDRIESIDRKGPTLKSILETNPDAMQIAETLDREREEKGPRGPLHGIPIVLKDNIDTNDKMTTTAGSLALEGSVPLQDSFVAEQLRKAGAVLLAKANLSEWANFRAERSSSGWSGRGGQCKNPYALNRNPCGSSSGSAVAASANLCAGAIGTETNGSIVCPSNSNGVVGIKPTVGLISRSGIIPISHTQDTAGPITRTVTDAVTILSALTGVDPRDPATELSSSHLNKNYSDPMKSSSLQGLRIGVGRQYFGFHEKVDAVMEDSIRVLEKLGATIIDKTEIPNRRAVNSPSFQVLLYEFKADLNRYLEELGPEAPVKSLEEIIRFNEENADREMPYFGQELFIQAQEKGPLTDKPYLEALEKARSLSREKGLDTVMAEKELDAILAPTGGPAWVTDLINGDHFSGGSSSAAAVAGYPNITVPAGFVHDLPVGISFFSTAWNEIVLIQIAYAFEQATKIRKSPKFLPTLPS
jgi:amidase